MLIRVFTLWIVVIAISVVAARAECLAPEPRTVTLNGFIYAKDFPGPPNYESIRRGDERMRYWILRLKKPICVEGDDFNRNRVASVLDLQLVFADVSFYKKYRAFVRRGVRFQVVGSLFHQHTCHHVTEVLLKVKRLVPLGR